MDMSPDISASTLASQTETTSCASDDSYRIRRARNNNSVRKSREKTRQVFQEKLDRVKFLKEENAKLEMHMLHLKAQLKTLEEKAFPRKNVSPQNHCEELLFFCPWWRILILVFSAYKMSDVIMNGKKFDKIYEDIVENACIAHEILRKCNGFAVETICKERGINLMEVKFHVLMNYVALLKYIILKNSVGKDSADESLVEISTVLGRTRPLIEKMSNEMQKLLESVSSDGTVDCIADEAEIAAVIEQDEGKNADNCNVLQMQDKYKNDVQLYIFPKLITTHYHEQDGQDIGHICRCFTYSTVIDDNKLQYSHVDEDIMDQQEEGNEQQILFLILFDWTVNISHTQLLELRDILRYLTEPKGHVMNFIFDVRVNLLSTRCTNFDTLCYSVNSAFIPTSTIHLIPRKDYTVISTEKQKRKNIFQKYSEVPLTAVIRGQKLEPRLNLPYG
ncbi:Neuroguidin [Trichinella patagoniensis]|uniref:Neuroguidin n=2 Tax=Trichinella TaxID=6333 RepID=A0A0V0ZAU9_9BILA|nr:Neuroguidin [Trichinella patagoniensis]